MKRLSIAVLAATAGTALVAGACSTGSAPAGGRPKSVEAATSATPAPTPSPTVSTRRVAADSRPLPDGWRRCVNTHYRYSIAYPRTWHTAQLNADQVCGQFDPRPFEIPSGSEPPLTALNSRQTQTSFDEYLRAVSDPTYAVTVLRQKTTVLGHRAYRLEEVSTGEGLYPKGTRRYGYVIDRAGGTFTVYTMATAEACCYAQHKAVVDHAVRTLRFLGQPPAASPRAPVLPGPPLFPFATYGQVREWQQAYRSGGHQPWHLDPEQTALAYTSALGLTGVDRIVDTQISGSQARVTVGRAAPDGPTTTVATIWLARWGTGADAPWEVVGPADISR
jgi:hypothetical protein